MSARSGQRLSPLRIVVVLAIVGGLVALGYVGWNRGRSTVDDLTTTRPATFFAPYVDVTLQPPYAFEDPDAGPAPMTALGFVVADPREPCTPTWGTQYDLEGAGSELDLDRRIARVRERGSDVVVSFGGVANADLAVACKKQAAVTSAYRAVLNRYKASTIDLDIEGAALADAAANARRAAAIRDLQKSAPSGRPLEVWLTLPVTPAGLTPDGVRVVDGMLKAGVKLAGVNVMAMDYGASKPKGTSMGSAAKSALTATHAQLGAAYRRAGHPLTAQQLWTRLGVTAMVGRNDVEGEVFSIADASSLADFARQVGLHRVSIWSANRDEQCGEGGGDGWQVLPICSGVEQKPLQFTRTFLNGLHAWPKASAAPQQGPTEAKGRADDDPRTSPYPIWRADRSYKAGEKVVWQRIVYEAKWYTDNKRPDQPAANEWDTPWRIIGPVLPSDARGATAASAAGPQRWSSDAVYLRGDRVRSDGYLYEARWRTQAEKPELDPDRPDIAAWTVIGRALRDVPPVFERYPAWRAVTSYTSRARVSLRGYVYEARRENRAVRPVPAPPQPARAVWRVVGRVPPRGG
jgi:chitinase